MLYQQLSHKIFIIKICAAIKDVEIVHQQLLKWNHRLFYYLIQLSRVVFNEKIQKL